MTQQTLLEKLTEIATTKVGGPMPVCLRAPGDANGFSTVNWATPLMNIAQEALNEIERLRIGTIYHTWQPLDTAPVPSATEINPRVYRFRCMLQNGRAWVFEGNAHYVQFSRARKPEWVLRWYDAANRLCANDKDAPIYWMPLPAPKQEK